MARVDPRFTQASRHLAELLASGAAPQARLESQLQLLLDNLDGARGGATASQAHERVEIQSRLTDFTPQRSPALAVIAGRGFDKLTFAELRSMGEVMAHHAGIEIDRQAKRRRSVFMKWLHDNWETLEPHFGYMEMRSDSEDEAGE
jgi:hypothetical protein